MTPRNGCGVIHYRVQKLILILHDQPSSSVPSLVEERSYSIKLLLICVNANLITIIECQTPA